MKKILIPFIILTLLFSVISFAEVVVENSEYGYIYVDSSETHSKNIWDTFTTGAVVAPKTVTNKENTVTNEFQGSSSLTLAYGVQVSITPCTEKPTADGCSACTASSNAINTETVALSSSQLSVLKSNTGYLLVPSKIAFSKTGCYKVGGRIVSSSGTPMLSDKYPKLVAVYQGTVVGCADNYCDSPIKTDITGGYSTKTCCYTFTGSSCSQVASCTIRPSCNEGYYVSNSICVKESTTTPSGEQGVPNVCCKVNGIYQWTKYSDCIDIPSVDVTQCKEIVEPTPKWYKNVGEPCNSNEDCAEGLYCKGAGFLVEGICDAHRGVEIIGESVSVDANGILVDSQGNIVVKNDTQFQFKSTQLPILSSQLDLATSSEVVSAICKEDKNCLPYEVIEGTDQEYTVKCVSNAKIKGLIEDSVKEECDVNVGKLLTAIGTGGGAFCVTGIALMFVPEPIVSKAVGGVILGTCLATGGTLGVIGGSALATEFGCEMQKQGLGDGLCIANIKGQETFAQCTPTFISQLPTYVGFQADCATGWMILVGGVLVVILLVSMIRK